ncbi:hypothetical protein JHK84_056370 [Glycine max]|nr:hypothetical protein JHK84_056370 [Glycine max]
MMLFCRIWKSSDLSPRSNIKDTLEKTRVNSLESASNHNLQDNGYWVEKRDRGKTAIRSICRGN